MKKLAIVATALLVAACGQADSTAGLTRLGTAGIRTTLPGTTLSYVVRSHDDNVWTFGCDGEWTITGAYSGMGSYVIREDQFCIGGRNGETSFAMRCIAASLGDCLLRKLLIAAGRK
jgi:hypothetical protein